MGGLRFAAGFVAALFGILGVVASGVGILVVWNAADRIDDSVARVAQRIDTVMVKIEQRADQVTGRIEGTRTLAQQLNERVQQKVARLREPSSGETMGIDQLERQLVARIVLVQDWIGFMQSSMELVQQLMDVLQSASLYFNGEASQRGGRLDAIRAGRDEVRHTLELVEEVKTSLAEIRQHRNVEENAKKITTLSSVIRNSLKTILGRLQNFTTGVAEVRTELSALVLWVHREVVVAAIGFTLILIWLGIAQACLAWCGWKVLRRRFWVEHQHADCDRVG